MNGKRLTVLACVLALVGGLFAAFGPTGQGAESSGAAGGAVVERSYSVSSFHTDGWWVLVVLSVPVLLALIPILMPRRNARLVSAALLWTGCVISLASVGIFLIPAAIAMTVASTRPEIAPGRSDPANRAMTRR